MADRKTELQLLLILMLLVLLLLLLMLSTLKTELKVVLSAPSVHPSVVMALKRARHSDSAWDSVRRTRTAASSIPSDCQPAVELAGKELRKF